MRRLLAWIAGAAGGLAAYRLLRGRRGGVAAPPPVPAGPDPRAAELRARLAEAREAPPAEASAPPVDAPSESGPSVESRLAEAAPPAPSPEERRRSVHEQGRAALDEMRRGEQ